MSLGEQAMEAAKQRDESRARKVWLDAWYDPVASLRAHTPCVRLADLHGDGDSKLLVAGADRKLRVYKGTYLLSENVLLDAPVAICAFYPTAQVGACAELSRPPRGHRPPFSPPPTPLRAEARASVRRRRRRPARLHLPFDAPVLQVHSPRPPHRRPRDRGVGGGVGRGA